jgi:hypothetical protein
MSKKSNVNPDHYKVAGRERQGENIVHQVEKSKERHSRAGISNRESPAEEARERREHPPVDTSSPPPEDAAGRTDEPKGE